MPSDEYATIAGAGALRLKGAKVQKRKKKNKSKGKDVADKLAVPQPEADAESAKPDDVANEGGQVQDDDDEDDESQVIKTESERRYEEAKKKRMLQMARASGARPELLKTHKERVEELNTYLSKLSEHHDMPKIGPG
ncbi:hypothetical protein CP532_3776 [Ophiocordyceps camponoti-leonardi (nom. inval.)]|nr:hypothetical protein CP532_3776 [Ophiocordyceps camponoti-leonardi (nom. inval.)]